LVTEFASLPSIPLQYSAFATGDHGSGSTMLTCRPFSTVARPGAAISFIVYAACTGRSKSPLEAD
jgi:hypothetical protein